MNATKIEIRKKVPRARFEALKVTPVNGGGFVLTFEKPIKYAGPKPEPKPWGSK